MTFKKKRESQLFASKMSLGIAENCNSGQAKYGEPKASQENRREGLLLWRKGGSWEGLFQRVQGGDGHSLAKCGSLPLAGRLQGEILSSSL